MDPFILAAQVRPEKGYKIIDIGCGCGIIPLILGNKFKDIHIMGIEIQTQLAEFAKKNTLENLLSDRIHILNKDIKNTTSFDIQGLADIIVSSPVENHVG